MEKRDVLRDWQERFPALSPYTSSTLYMKADIVLMGLRCENVMSGVYRIFFECLPLWENEKKKMMIPVFCSELLDGKGLQFFIDYRLHDRLFPMAAAYVEKQFGIFLKEYISVDDVCGWLKKLSSSFVPEHNPIKLYRIFEFKLALALFFDDNNLFEKIEKEIDAEIRYWDSRLFERLFHQTVQTWKAALFLKMEDREAFVRQVHLNRDNKKIMRLKEIHFRL